MTDHTAMSWVILLIVLSTGTALGTSQQQSILTPPSNVTGEVGGKAEFKCEVEVTGILVFAWEFNQHTVYSLQYDEEQYPRGRDKYSVERNGGVFTLTVNDLEPNDGGNYTCRVLKQAAEAHLFVKDVAKHHTIITPPKDTTGKLGGSAKFTCEVEFTSIPVLEWEFNGDIVYSLQFDHEEYPLENKKYTVTRDKGTFILTVQDLHFYDGGEYICRVLKQAEKAHLIVADTQKISFPTPTPEEGNTAEYACTVHFTGPKKEDILSKHYPALRMFFNGELLNGTVKEEMVEGTTIYYKLTLLQNITLRADAHRKELLCELKSSSLDLYKNITSEVEVLYAVRHISYSPIKEKYDKGNVITCLADGNPEPSFQWVDTTNTAHSSGTKSLIITKQMDGSTTWRCTATNTINGQSHQEYVTVNFKVEGESAISTSESENDSWKIAVGVTVPVCLVVMGVIITAWYCRRHRSKGPGYLPVSLKDVKAKNQVNQMGEEESRNALLTDKIALLESEKDLGETATEALQLLRNQTSVGTALILLIRKSPYLIESHNYFALMQEMVEIYKKNQGKKGLDPLVYLVEVLEVDSPLTQHHAKIINLLQILIPLDSSIGTRTRCMRLLIRRTLEWKVCKGEAKTDQDTSNKPKPLQWNSDYINILKCLLNEGADPSWSPTGSTEGSNLHLLMMVVPQVFITKPHLMQDFLDLLKIMTPKSFACNNVDGDNKTILHVFVDCKQNMLITASTHEFQQVISNLRSQNLALIDAKDNSNLTPLHTFWSGIQTMDHSNLTENFLASVDNIVLLLKSENNIDIQTQRSRTILHEVVSIMSPDLRTGVKRKILELIKSLKSQQNTDAQDSDGNTALHLLVHCAKDWLGDSDFFLEAVKCLKSDKNIIHEDRHGRTPLQIFQKCGNAWKDDPGTFLKVFKELISSVNFESIYSIGKDVEAVHDILTSWAKDLADHPKAFLEIDKFLVSPDVRDKQNKYGDTVLHKFTSWSKKWIEHPKIFLEVVKCLKSAINIDIKNDSHETPLYIFTIFAGEWKDHPHTFCEVVQYLKSPTNIYIQTFLGHTALHRFISCAVEWRENPKKFVEVVKYLSPLNTEIRNNLGQTALHIFTSKAGKWKDNPDEFMEVIKCLESPTSSDVKTNEGYTPLHLFMSGACEWTKHPEKVLDVIKHLKSNTNINITTNLGNTALHNLTSTASEWKKHPGTFLDIIVQYLKSSTNIDCQNKMGATALHLFASNTAEWKDNPTEFLHVVEHLQSENNIHLQDDNGRTPMHLIMYGALEWKDNPEIFLEVVKNLKSCTVVDKQNNIHETALHLFMNCASEWNSYPQEFLKVVRCLRSPMNIDIKNGEGSTALHLFTSKAGKWRNEPEQFFEVVQLLKSPSNIDCTDNSSCTALHLFTSKVYEWKYHLKTVTKVVKSIISPTNISVMNNAGETALHVLTFKASEWINSPETFSEVVRLLVSPAVIDMTNKSGETALHIFASKLGRWKNNPAVFLEVVKLLKSPTNCDFVNSEGFTALHVLASHAMPVDKFVEVAHLLKSSTNIEKRNNAGETALHIFASKADKWKDSQANFLEVVNLLKSLTNCEFVNNRKFTALFKFILQADEWQKQAHTFLQTVNCLRSDDNIDKVNDMNDTPLHAFANKASNWKNDPETFLEVVELLKSSTNIDHQNNSRYTPLRFFISMADSWVALPQSYLQVVKCLRSDSNIDIKNDMDTTALHMLTWKAGQWKDHPDTFLKIVEFLKSPKNTDFQTARGYTALHRFTTRASEWKGQTETFVRVVKCLKSSTNINAENMYGHVPLHTFTRHTSEWADNPKIFLEVVECLKSETNIDIQDKPDGDTALHNLLFPLINWGNYEKEFIFFIKSQMESSTVELQPKKETIPNHMYICHLKNVQRHHLETLCELIKKIVSPDIEVTEENDDQIEIKIFDSKKCKWVNSLDVFLKVVKCLVSDKNINLKNHEGETALHLFARSKSEWAEHPEIHEVVELLMSPENMTLKNNYGKTPLELFEENWVDQAKPVLEMAASLSKKL